MRVENRFLFNFAASYSAGGYKRLHEYAKWFNGAGGAWFAVHPNCSALATEFPNNRFFILKQSRVRRLFDDCGYLPAIGREIGQPDLYYSYGMPVYFRFGKVNWFHLSNVLPLAARGIPLSLYDRLRLGSLGRRISRAFANADVISAESNFSLGLIDDGRPGRLFLSVNGSDDELAYIHERSIEQKDDLATVIGTYSHKALRDSLRVFQMLRGRCDRLKLMVIGDAREVPRELHGTPNVIVRGVLTRPEVISCLRAARYYISTTLIENSYNAASEGIFTADESYISDIGPHRELLAGMHFDEVSIPDLDRRLLHVKRDELSNTNLKTWDTVIVEMIARFHEARRV
jgi:glycosyltransferase involved in cell wall biosynthesis